MVSILVDLKSRPCPACTSTPIFDANIAHFLIFKNSLMKDFFDFIRFEKCPVCISTHSAFNNLDLSLEEASMDLGENQFGTFYRVILPLVLPGIIASLLIGFTLSLDEFIIAFFLTGTDTTLPVYIWAQFRFPKKLPATMALGTILLIVSLMLLSLSEYFRRRSRMLEDSIHNKN